MTNCSESMVNRSDGDRMYSGKYTSAKTPQDFVVFLRGLGEDVPRLAAGRDGDAVNADTSRFLTAAAAYVEDLTDHGVFADASPGLWQSMIDILSAAVVYPGDDPEAPGG